MKREFREMLNQRGRKTLPNVLLAAAECAPLSKTGGLADVVGTLPKSLARLGIDARVITPYHRVIKEKYAAQVQHLFYFFVDLGWRHEYVGIEKLELDGVIIYLVDSERYFGDKIYRGGYDEIEQYAFFCRAVLNAIPNLGFTPDVVHCNDWHTAMIPMLARTQYPGAMQENMRFLLTIHNIAFQGKCGFDFVQDLLGVDAKYYTAEFMELYGCANFLKAGCVFAHKINTVSPSYAWEIRTPYFSEGLDGILNARANDLSGIINGIDKQVFNPKTDAKIPARFDRGHLKGKAQCKAALQQRLGLEVRADVPLFAMVTRMTEQKGFDLLNAVAEEMLSCAQIAVLGTGDRAYEDYYRALEARHPGRFSAQIRFSEPLSRRMYAGADIFLMPSRFEPCGLSQMISMRYGTVPVVRQTGGLADSVEPYNRYTGEGTGFGFLNFNAHELLFTTQEACRLYTESPVAWGNLAAQGMAKDFSWRASALEYRKLYRGLFT